MKTPVWMCFLPLFIIASCTLETNKKTQIYYPPKVRQKVAEKVDALNHPHWQKREKTTGELIEMGPYYSQLFERFLGKVNSEQEWRLRYVLSHLGWKDPALKDKIALALEKLKYSSHADKGREDLLEMGQAVLPNLLAQLNTRDMVYLYRCLEVIVLLEDNRAAFAIAKKLTHPHPRKRSLSRALVRIGNRQVIPHVARALHLHIYRDYDYCRDCAEVLFALAGPAALPFVVDLLGQDAYHYPQRKLVKHFLHRCTVWSLKIPGSGEGEEVEYTLQSLQRWWKANRKKYWTAEMEKYFEGYTTLKKNKKKAKNSHLR